MKILTVLLFILLTRPLLADAELEAEMQAAIKQQVELVKERYFVVGTAYSPAAEAAFVDAREGMYRKNLLFFLYRRHPAVDSATVRSELLALFEQPTISQEDLRRIEALFQAECAKLNLKNC